MRALRLIAVLLLLALPASAADPPNIIVVLVDDISACWVGKYTTDIAGCIEGIRTDEPGVSLTPNMDAMAAGGVTFTNAWAEPVCAPARFAMLTGTTRRANGWISTQVDLGDTGGRDLHPARPNMARTLSPTYRTVHIGKWHLGGRDRGNGSAANGNGQFFHPTSVGFEESYGSIGNLSQSVTGVGDFDFLEWEGCDFAAGTCGLNTTYATTDTIDRAVTAMGGSQPFALYVATNASHRPNHEPPTPSLYTAHDDCDGDLVAADKENVCYKLATQALDTELKRIFDVLDAAPSPNWTDTVVILIGDNGMTNDVAIEENSSWQAGRMKNTVGNGGLWVPLIVRGAGVATDETSAALVHIADIHATVLDLAGVAPDVASHNTGSMMPSTGNKARPYRSVSFVPSLSDVSYAGGRECIYSERYNVTPDATDTMHEEAIRNDTYKLIIHHDASAAKPEELFLVTNQYEAADSDLWTVNGGSYTPTEQAACEDLQAKLALMHDETRGNPCR